MRIVMALYGVYRRIVLFAISVIIAILLAVMTICMSIFDAIDDFDLGTICYELRHGMTLCRNTLLIGLGIGLDEEEAPD